MTTTAARTATGRPIDTRPRRIVSFTPMETRRDVLVEAAVLAEELGYEAIAVPEGWGLDAGVVLSEIAHHTDRLRLVAGVLSVWGRSAGTLAMLAATLDDLSGGRFTLGLGASTPALTERFHRRPFEAPARQLEQVVADVRALLAGERPSTANGDPGLRLGAAPRPDVPIWVAGLGARTTAMAHAVADAWYPAVVPRDHFTRYEAAEGVEVVCGPLVAPATNPDEAAWAARQIVGWYLTGMGSLYGDFVAEQGWAEPIAALRAANPRPQLGALDWPAAADPLLEQLTVGIGNDPAEALVAWDGLVDVVTVGIGPGSPADVLSAIRAAAPPAS